LFSLLAADRPGLSTAQSGWLADLVGRAPAQPEALAVLLLAAVGIGISTVVGACACVGAPRRAIPSAAAQDSNQEEDTVEPQGTAAPTVLFDSTRALRREAAEAIISTGFALLALWLVATFFLNPQPWLRLGQELLRGVELPGSADVF
jgi:hypothetical protein